MLENALLQSPQTGKNTLQVDILDSQKTPPNTPKILKMPFGNFFGICLVFSQGSTISAWGVFFRHVLEIPGRAILGLCSGSGRSQFYAIRPLILWHIFGA